jgi:hypothetical protein
MVSGAIKVSRMMAVMFCSKQMRYTENLFFEEIQGRSGLPYRTSNHFGAYALFAQERAWSEVHRIFSGANGSADILKRPCR